MADKENQDFKDQDDEQLFTADDQQFQATDDKDSSSNSDDERADDNVADRASQNDENQVNPSDVHKELDDSTQEDKGNDEDGGITQDDYGQYGSNDSNQFDENTQRMTTESPEERDHGDSDNSLSGLGDPIDSDLSLIKQRLTQNHKSLANLDMSQPDALNKMRDIMLFDNKAEQKMYHLLDQLEYSSADYSEIKDKLINSEDKDKLSKYLDELSPLFKVTDKKQMNTFIDAFHRINNIQKNGSLTNLIELADYYNTYFKKQKGDQKDDSNEHKKVSENDSEPGKNGKNE